MLFRLVHCDRNVDSDISEIIEYWPNVTESPRYDFDLVTYWNNFLARSFNFGIRGTSASSPFLTSTEWKKKHTQWKNLNRNIPQKASHLSLAQIHFTHFPSKLVLRAHMQTIYTKITTNSTTLCTSNNCPRHSIEPRGKRRTRFLVRTWTERKSHCYVKQTHSKVYKLSFLFSLSLFFSLSISILYTRSVIHRAAHNTQHTGTTQLEL